MSYHLYPVLISGASVPPGMIPASSTSLAIPLDVPRGSRGVCTNTWRILDENRITPSDAAVELYRLALLAYAADTRITREDAFDGWTRDIVLHLPVANERVWTKVSPLIEKLLTFLSGDRWRVRVFTLAVSRPSRDEKAWRQGSAIPARTVSLFSGGLDSLIGALDFVGEGEATALVGHFEAGSTAKFQSELAEVLDSHFPNLTRLMQFMVQPTAALTGETESTTRSRSFLFFSLATLVASELGESGRLLIPENGFIALNAPLTITRLGALSTRTAHPHTIQLFREVLAGLNLNLSLEAPYAFRTKGEMVQNCRTRQLLRKIAPATMSCAHAAAGRWEKASPSMHCGYCVPCIIRRAALNSAGWDDSGGYRIDVLSGSVPAGRVGDLRAFLTAIERSRGEPAMTAVLRAGPIAEQGADVQKYLGVYERGLKEVETFLAGRSRKKP